MARLDKAIADLAQQFVLVRVNSMRGVNLDLFDFDYDTTWAGFFLDAEERVFGRFGGRDADSPEKYASLAGLKYAMRQALVAYRRAGQEKVTPPVKASRTAEQYPAASRFRSSSCIHCHHVHEFRRAALQSAGQWRPEQEWRYPPPENVGLTLAVDQGNRVTAITAGSAASKLGLRAGDVLHSVNGVATASFADVQYGLHRAPPQGQIALVWQRGAQTSNGDLALAPGWRRSDISWRWSLRSLDPAPCVRGEDLSPAQKKGLGLDPKRLAFVQGNFVSAVAEQAGLRQGDIIVGVDDQPLEMTERQFGAFIRLNYKVGDRITLNVVRAGQRLNFPLTLPGRGTY